MKQALEMALEALETPRPFDSYPPLWRAYEKTINEAITAIKEALAQPEQEPVAWWIPKAEQFCLPSSDGTRPFAKAWEPLYTTPPQRTWVGLTDEEVDQGLLRSNHALQTAGAWRDGVEWATKQLKEKNT